MAKRCEKCGTFLTDVERFCPNCGENVNVAETEPSVRQEEQYRRTDIQPPLVAYSAPAEPPMSIKKWVATILLTSCLGLISIILLFVWGFGSGPEERQKYCKAMLIVHAILIVLSIIFYAVISAILLSFVNDLLANSEYWAEWIAENSDGFYNAATAVFSFT